MTVRVARLLAATMVLGLTCGVLHGQSSRSQQNVSLTMPLDFAFALADVGAPAGIEIAERDDIAPQAESLRRLSALARRIGVDQLVRSFNSAQQEYRADMMDGVVVVRPAGQHAAFLDVATTPIPESTTIVGTLDAIRMLLAPLDQRLRGTHVSSVLGADAARGAVAQIRLDTTGKTVVEVLNQIPRQVPGAWKVVTRPLASGRGATIVSYGYIYTHGGFVDSKMPQ